MHFCEKCNNMYYISIDEVDKNSLVFYCRKCGNINKSFSKDKVCISKIHYKKPTNNFNYLVNEYTKLDPTLPRVNNITCINAECGNSKKIIYIRYDNSNMKYIYICPKCDTVWKTDKHKN